MKMLRKYVLMWIVVLAIIIVSCSCSCSNKYSVWRDYYSGEGQRKAEDVGRTLVETLKQKEILREEQIIYSGTSCLREFLNSQGEYLSYTCIYQIIFYYKGRRIYLTVEYSPAIHASEACAYSLILGFSELFSTEFDWNDYPTIFDKYKPIFSAIQEYIPKEFSFEQFIENVSKEFLEKNFDKNSCPESLVTRSTKYTVQSPVKEMLYIYRLVKANNGVVDGGLGETENGEIARGRIDLNLKIEQFSLQ